MVPQPSQTDPPSFAVANQPTGLLVSVRDAAEFQLVQSLPPQLAELIQVIDLKEPNSGPLGRANFQTAANFLTAISSDFKTSVAMGELRDWKPTDRPAPPTGFQFAKLGLAGSASNPDWRQHWHEALNATPQTTQRVAVVYLDHQLCDAPPPEQIIAHAASAGCRGVLFDTYTKSAGSFTHHLTVGSLESLLENVRHRGMFSVLAGSVTTDNLPTAIGLRPTLIGVRGAICDRHRTSGVRPDKLKTFCEAFHIARNN